MADLERLVVDEDQAERFFVLVARQQIDGRGEVAVGDLVVLKKAGQAEVAAVLTVRFAPRPAPSPCPLRQPPGERVG
jgi:hypothetical protein